MISFLYVFWVIQKYTHKVKGPGDIDGYDDAIEDSEVTAIDTEQDYKAEDDLEIKQEDIVPGTEAKVAKNVLLKKKFKNKLPIERVIIYI